MSGNLPIPQGNYIPAKRHGDLIVTSGMTPRREGVLIMTGPVRAATSLTDYHDAVRLACGNALTAANALLGGEESITTILSLTVYIAADPVFTSHSKLADVASDYLRDELGSDGIGARAAVGVATLPGNAPVEIQLMAVAGPNIT